jgi:hypothetical protein
MSFSLTGSKSLGVPGVPVSALEDQGTGFTTTLRSPHTHVTGPLCFIRTSTGFQSPQVPYQVTYCDSNILTFRYLLLLGQTHRIVVVVV